MPYIENLGARLYYEETGQGRPLIFLHGFSWNMNQWRHQVDHFSAHWRVITLDARGHGKSTLPAGKVDSDVFWRDVVALMDHLSIPKASICGLSMGGHVAIQTAIYAGDRVERLILIGAVCTNQLTLYERLIVPVNRFCQRLLPMPFIAWCIAAGVCRFSPEVRPYIRSAVRQMSHDVYNRMWRAVSTMDSRASLGRITCPTLILVGDHDTMTRRQQPYIHQHIRNSRLVTIANAHHGTNLDNPQQVEQEMESFLSTGSCPT